MPRRTPVKELLKEEEVPSSPLRRSSRITNSSPVPTKVVTRRNSASESTSSSTPKVTRGRRSSFSQEVDSNNETQADKKKSTSTVRTRRGSLTQSSEDPPSEESVPKTRTRGSSVPKDQKTAEVKKTTRRRRSVSEDSEATEVETVGKSTRSRSGSLSSLKKKESNEEKISEDVPASTPNKKLVSTEIPSIKLQSVEESSKEVGSPDNVTSSSAPKRRTDVVKIDLDLSVINEASLTEEEISPHKKSKVDEPTSENLTDLEPKNLDKPLQPASAEKNTNIEIEDKSSVEKTQVVEEPNNKSENKPKNLDKSLQKNTNIEIEDKTSVEKTQVVEEPINKSVNKESTTKNETENEMFDSTMSENSFKLQLSPSTLEDTDPNVNANDSGNKENISPKVTEFACEPMDVDEPEPSPIKKVIKPSRLSLSKKVTEAEHKLQLAEKITDEIDKFLTEENSLRLNNKTNDHEQMKVQNKTLVVNIVRIEENNTKLSNEKIPENEVVLQEKQTLAANSAIEKIEEGDGKNVDVTYKLKTDEAAMEDQEPNTAALDNENLNTNENATELVSGSNKIVKTDIEPITNTIVQEVTTKDTVVVVTNVIPCQMEHPVEQKTNGNATEQDKVDHLNSSKLESTEKEFEKVVDISVSSESEKLANTSTSPEVMDEAVITEIAKSETSAQGTESPLQEQRLLSDSKDDEINIPESNNSGNDESINQIEKTDACDDSSTIKNFESETDRSTLNKENIITEIQNEEKCNANEENAVGLEVATSNENREGSVIEENFAGESEITDSVDGTKSNEENSYLSPVKKIENNDIVINGEQRIESVELDCSEVINISDGENDHESSRDEVAKNSAPENEEKSTNGENVEEIKADDNSILSRSIRKRSLDRTSITLHETVKAGEDKEKTVSKRIHKVVDLFCAGIKTTADVSINVSLEYTGQVSDSDDEKTDLLEISLVATVDDVEKESEIKKGSKRRKICHDEHLQSPEKREEEFRSTITTESSPKIVSKKTESPKNEQTENSVKQTSVRSDETEVSGGSSKKRKKRESLTSVSTIEEKIKESSPNKKVASKSNKRKSENDEDDFNKLELEIDGKETPFKEKSSTPFKSPKVKEFSEGEEIIPLDDFSDDSSENVSEDENNISQSEEKPTLILLAEPLEDSDDNDTTWKPPEENDMIDSESNDSEDDLAESFMEEVKTQGFLVEKSRRPKRTTAVNNEAYETSSSISPKKAKVRKSPTTSARESGNEASPKSKVSISSGDETSGSGKKSKKQRLHADEQESNTKTDTNTSSGKRKVNSTPYKYTKVEISSEDEENDDIDHLTGSDENEVADDSDFSDKEKNSHYVSLLSKSFEDSDANDTTWRPGRDADDSATDESESSEEESFMEKTRKEMSSVSNDSVFEEEDKVTENKAKKRKMFRLSRMNVLENLESSDSRESLDNKKKQMKKETKSRKKELFTKKTKQSNTNDFQETDHVKKMLPESSEVKNKSKKRKHSNPDDGVDSPSKTKIEKLLPDLREKLNRNKPKNKKNIAKNLYIKPSKKAPSGWSVTNL